MLQQRSLVRKNSREKIIVGGLKWRLRNCCTRRVILVALFLGILGAVAVLFNVFRGFRATEKFNGFAKERSAHLAGMHEKHALKVFGEHKLRGPTTTEPEIWEWVALSSSLRYKRHMQSDSVVWEEMDGSQTKFKFQEVSANGDEVLLHDSSRSMYVRLNDLEAAFFNGELSDSASFTMFETGMWTIVRGVHVELSEDGQSPPKPQHSEEEHGTASILLMLAAYRDPLCGNTLMEAFKFAKYPDRVRAAVVEQNDASDNLSCVENYCELVPDCRRDQVKVITMDLDHSRGVMPARYRQHELIEDEEFCLQTDAHSAFEDDWDMVAIEDWFSIQNEMAVITAYPNRVRDRHKISLTPTRCDTKFDSRNEIVHGGNAAHNIRPMDKPQMITFFGAGTSFGKCHANLNVPYDPYLSFMFGGEEYNRAARLWTWGYDMYAQKRNIVFHYYDTEEKPEQGRAPRKRDFVSADKYKGELASESVARWRAIFGLEIPQRIKKLSTVAMENASLFGLGSRRNIKDFFEFSGVDWKNVKLETRCNRIGRLKWHPYLHNDNFDPRCYKSSASPTCCTTMDLVRSDAQRMLQLKNNELNDLLEAAPAYKDPVEPMISPLALGTVPCPGD